MSSIVAFAGHPGRSKTEVLLAVDRASIEKMFQLPQSFRKGESYLDSDHGTIIAFDWTEVLH
jgi:hypothetical protein